jgi:hypothetical protein
VTGRTGPQNRRQTRRMTALDLVELSEPPADPCTVILGALPGINGQT